MKAPKFTELRLFFLMFAEKSNSFGKTILDTQKTEITLKLKANHPKV